MQDVHRERALELRLLHEHGEVDRASFRAALLDVPAAERDTWIDIALGLDEPPDDGPALPQGCVPYLPCPVHAVLQVLEQVPLSASDVFVDIGSGLGRTAALVHLLSDAAVIGVEVQPHLVAAARELAARIHAERMACIEADAASLTHELGACSVFFLYCPFSGERLVKVLASLQRIAQARPITVCCVDLPLPPCSWLRLEWTDARSVAVYRSSAAFPPRREVRQR